MRPWINRAGCNLWPHLQSRHVGGLQSLLQGLAEEIITDGGPCWHRSYATGGVPLNQRQSGRKRRTKKNNRSTLMQTNFAADIFSSNLSIRFDKSHLARGCWRDRAAVGSAGESQRRRQLALRNWPRARRPAVAQRNGTHPCWASHSAGGSRWAPLLTNIHTRRSTLSSSVIIGWPARCIGGIKSSDSPTGSLPHRQTCPQTWSLLPVGKSLFFIFSLRIKQRDDSKVPYLLLTTNMSL